MTDKETGQFRLKFDETDSVMTNEILEQRVEKLSTRITIISILIPVLLGVVFTIAYFNIKKRVSSTQHSGVEKMDKLSKDLESRFSSLSIRFAKLEESLVEKKQTIQQMEEFFLSVEKKITSIKKELKVNRKDLSQIQTGKIDKKEFKSRISVLQESLSITDKSLNVLQNDMKSLISVTDALTENFKEELKTLTGFVEKEKNKVDQIAQGIKVQNEDITEIRQDITLLSQGKSSFVEKGEMGLAIKRANLDLKVHLEEAIRKMNKRLNSIESNLRETKKISASPHLEPDHIIENELE